MAFLEFKTKLSKLWKYGATNWNQQFISVFLLNGNIQLTKLDTPDNLEWDPEGRSESEKAYFHLRKNPLFLQSATPDWWALNCRVPQKRVGNANEYLSLLGFHGHAQKNPGKNLHFKERPVPIPCNSHRSKPKSKTTS